MRNKEQLKPLDENLDPITGAPGAHPGATGVGGMDDAAVGSIEELDPTLEDAYWREHYITRPYVETGQDYALYDPAYRTGYENYARYEGRPFDDVEADLRTDYERRTSNRGVSWERAKDAVRDAWERVERFIPGDSDRDGH